MKKKLTEATITELAILNFPTDPYRMLYFTKTNDMDGKERTAVVLWVMHSGQYGRPSAQYFCVNTGDYLGEAPTV